MKTICFILCLLATTLAGAQTPAAPTQLEVHITAHPNHIESTVAAVVTLPNPGEVEWLSVKLELIIDAQPEVYEYTINYAYPEPHAAYTVSKQGSTITINFGHLPGPVLSYCEAWVTDAQGNNSTVLREE